MSFDSIITRFFILHTLPNNPTKAISSISVRPDGRCRSVETRSVHTHNLGSSHRSSHRSATNLARLQQLTNGLENTQGGGGSDLSGALGVPTSKNPTANSISGAKPSKQDSA